MKRVEKHGGGGCTGEQAEPFVEPLKRSKEALGEAIFRVQNSDVGRLHVPVELRVKREQDT